MIASAQTLRELRPVAPFHEQSTSHGMTYGLGPHGYDVRLAEDHWMFPGRRFVLASTIERFHMPDNVAGKVHDKSTWARRGLTVQNTVIEAGWRGFLTLELIYHKLWVLRLRAGTPIAQVLFHVLDQPTEQPYAGKYQDQPEGPQPAKLLDPHP